MKKETGVLSRLLQFGADWDIRNIEVDTLSDRVDIVVSKGKQKKRLFGFSRREIDEPTITLQHLPLAGMRVYLHVPESHIADAYKTWAIDGSKLTRGMEAFIAEALDNCTSLHATAKLTQLSTQEVSDVSSRYGVTPSIAHKGSSVKQDIAITTTNANKIKHIGNASDATHSFELNQSIDVPVETHEIWDRLIHGDISVNFDSIALKMLLQRIRHQITLNNSEVTRLASIKLLRQYLIKNQHQHKQEIKQFSSSVSVAPEHKQPSVKKETGLGLPNIGAPCWNKIISGSVKINTDHVGLQMMIERLKLSVGGAAEDDQIRVAGSNMLHQFFTKHKKLLQKEIAQIGTPIKAVNKLTTASRLKLPTVSAPIWKKIMSGEMPLNTDDVGLQMMIERMRLLVGNDPSETTSISGAKILHRFFVKYKNQLQSEIQQLGGNTAYIIADDQPKAVPPDNHPNWQKLIDGDLTIKTDVVALKMMLESIRISVGNNPSSQARVTGAKMLRQYFLKHKRNHQHELEQLMVA